MEADLDPDAARQLPSAAPEDSLKAWSGMPEHVTEITETAPHLSAVP
jgi:hypothetical protein